MLHIDNETGICNICVVRLRNPMSEIRVLEQLSGN
jgi:hypothetical protein